MALLNRASIVKMRFLLITTIIYVSNITFAQNIQYGKIYKSAKIFFENGQRIEVKNLEFLNNTTVTYDNAITNQQLSEISQIQAKKGTASKGGIICGGACGLFMIVSALGGVFSSYEYEEYNNETNQNETKTEPGLSAGEVIVSTAIFAGISYGIGWLSGYIFDDWEVIYANQKLGISKRRGLATITTGIPKNKKINDAIDEQVFEYLPWITDKSLTPELLKSVDGFEVRIEQDERSLNIKNQDMYHDSNYVSFDLYEIDENKPYKLVIYYGDTTNTAFYVNARFDDKFFKPYSFPVGMDGQNISWDRMPFYTIAEYGNPEKNSLLAIDTDDKYDHHALRFDYKKKLQESYRTNGITVLKRHVKNYVYPPQLEFDGSVFITVRTKYFSKHIRLDYGSSATSKGLNNETKH